MQANVFIEEKHCRQKVTAKNSGYSEATGAQENGCEDVRSLMEFDSAVAEN